MKKILIYVVLVSFFVDTICAKNVRNLTLDEKIGQMIMVGISGTDPNEQWIKAIRVDIKFNRIGAIKLKKENIVSKKQLVRMLKIIKVASSALPVAIAIDQNGGYNSILNREQGFSLYPSQRSIADTRTLLDARKIYSNMSEELLKSYINMDLAPIVNAYNLDNLNEKINQFSKYDSIASAYTSEFLEAFKNQNVATCVKYFPAYPSLEKIKNGKIDMSDSWDFQNLKGFYNLIKTDEAKCVLVSNVYLKQLDENLPSSMSKKIVQGILRDSLKFDKIVISDDLLSKNLDNFPLKKRIISSVNAGVDMMYFSSYFTNNTNTPRYVKQVINEAINEGKISKSRIEDAYNHILEYKKELK